MDKIPTEYVSLTFCQTPDLIITPSVHNFTDYYATAFDSLNNAIDSFLPDSDMSSNIFATPSVTRLGIEVFEYHDFAKRVAIDNPSFNTASVHGQGILALLGLGIAGVALSRRMNSL